MFRLWGRELGLTSDVCQGRGSDKCCVFANPELGHLRICCEL